MPPFYFWGLKTMTIFEKIQSVKFKTVTIPAEELGTGSELKLQELSGGQHAEFIDRLKDADFRDSERKLTAFMFYNCLVDENGARQFQSEEEAEKCLDMLPASLVKRINTAMAKLNNEAEEDEKAKKK